MWTSLRTINTQAEYEALPYGALYNDSNGRTAQKRQPKAALAGPNHAYIVMQHKLMVENPKLYNERGQEAARRHAGYEMAAMGMGRIDVHNSELIPFPSPMQEREKFAKWTRNACNALYLSPAIVAVILMFWNLSAAQNFTLFQGVCLVITIASIVYRNSASSGRSGLYHLVDSIEWSVSEQQRLFRAECFEFYETLALVGNSGK